MPVHQHFPRRFLLKLGDLPENALGSTPADLYFPLPAHSFLHECRCIDPYVRERLARRERRPVEQNGGTEMKHIKVVERNNLLSHVAPGLRRKVTQPRHETYRDPRNHYVRTPALWQRVANATSVEPRYQPAAETVRIAKAAFAIASLTASGPEVVRVAQLLFDSFSHPAPDGIRSAPTRIRQLLYRAQPYQIDLQIEFRQETNHLVVTGQLLDVSHPDMIGRDVQVTLSNRRGSVAKTATNQHGEFRGEVENSGDLEVSFAGTGGKPIVIVLPKALEP